ncbi:thymocyte nuclear protein 1 isoform X1 [Microcaecilia unicolor]|uniref:Thymocyte nuclear protein 1 n=1 Tax=Microcaecilia unicolor TaxID=1415580 RepID=A0A6P7ZMQ5_9AMPH|nr:thymocyte nuclear protein 1 isoform X1 [Microcaecilia unicolor]XP_030078274.1 thymocyte nuclear protein 1 isoform X1 [Microcaecilia unicolor]
MPQLKKKWERSANLDETEPLPKEAKCEKLEEKETPAGMEGSSGRGQTSKKPSSTKKRSGTQVNPESYSHWLLKSEPESRLENGVDMKFSIEDLKAQPNQTACWDGVRNYQARNFLRAMRIGQKAFFYHSNCKEPGIAGIVKIVKEAYVDHTQFEKSNPHYDASSSQEKPKWSMVDVQFVRQLRRFIPLAELKVYFWEHQAAEGALKNMTLFTRQRLSVQPLTKEEYEFVLSVEDKKPNSV